ncbi:P27 family phage terminase small subunit [Inquilinus sp. CA228]|uniref:P27 family phage terminase small subunit n=1 Tax=Inquilinus sp. CA228 TaxID=3455609 RepID=UPI003F8CFEEE
MQAKKGYPGKRRSVTDRAIAEAERLAALLAAAPAEAGDPLAPPAYLDNPLLAPAMTVWRDYAPQLARVNLLARTDRHSFALLCVYTGEWIAAHEDILANGYSVLVKTVSGDKMPRPNPSVERRDTAMTWVMKLSEKFGLTPLDRYRLFKEQSNRPAGGLFDDPSPKPKPGADGNPPPADGEDDDVIGSMGRFDSPPPGSRPN